MSSFPDQLLKCSNDEQDFLLAMELVNCSIPQITMKATIKLGVLETLAKARPSQLSSSEIASQLPTNNKETPILVYSGIWAIPEKAVVLGGVEPLERSLSRKGSSNEGSVPEERRNFTLAGPRRVSSDAWGARDRQKVVTNWSFSFNPRPFNIKEHVLITIFASCGASGVYAVHIIAMLRAHSDAWLWVGWYIQKMPRGLSIHVVASKPGSSFSIQIGSGLSGLGIGAIGIDWSTVSSFLGSPLATPLFAIVNTLVGFALVMSKIALVRQVPVAPRLGLSHQTSCDKQSIVRKLLLACKEG
ncbi:hypothetical protein WN943_006443 [Citrus x changshan-huyou]